MSTVRIYSWIEVELPNRPPVRLGLVQQPTTLDPAGSDIYQKQVTVANNATATLFTAATDLADFDFLAIYSDQPLLVELQGTTAADNSRVPMTAKVPLILAPDDTLGYNAAGAFAGAAMTIKKILVKNTSGFPAAVQIVAAT